jgi:hypothetical protein
VCIVDCSEQVHHRMVLDGLWAARLGLFTAASWIEWLGIMLALGVDLQRLGPVYTSRKCSTIFGGGIRQTTSRGSWYDEFPSHQRGSSTHGAKESGM